MINMTINNVNNTIYSILPYIELPWRLSGKESTFYAGDPSSIPAFGRSPGGGHDNPLQYSCLENTRHRGVWQATVHGVTGSDMTDSTEHIHT